jgi:hypothetical protein
LAIGIAGDDTGPAVMRAALGAPTSATVPHAWHSPHRPIHRGVVHPHSLHANGDFPALDLVDPAAFTMSANLIHPTDKPRQTIHKEGKERGRGKRQTVHKEGNE